MEWTSRFAQLRQVLAPPAVDDMYMHLGGESLVSVYELLTTCGKCRQ